MKLYIAILLALTLSATVLARKRDHKGLRYASTPGVSRIYQSLDWYQPSRRNFRKGVIVYVHGGAWKMGDKKNAMRDKVRRFRDELGYNFVSINYRLMDGRCWERARRRNVPCDFPDNAEDVAAAIAFVLSNARKYGASDDSVALIGHSAGAHLAALVSTDESYLKRHGLTLSDINFVAPLDTDAFDLRARSGNPAVIENAFGDDERTLRDASPILHVKKKRGRCEIPPHLVVYRGERERKRNVESYVRKLQRNRCYVKTFDASRYDHSQINKIIGTRGDKIVTPEIESMLVYYNNGL